MSRQTVGQIKEWLSQYPDDMPIQFFTDYFGEPDYWLSDYKSEDGTTLYVDIGNED